LGDAGHPKAMAVVISNGLAGHKRMFVGRASTRFIDVTEHHAEPVYTNNDGWADFTCPARSVSVWVQV
jgi:alpha-amylase